MSRNGMCPCLPTEKPCCYPVACASVTSPCCPCIPGVPLATCGGACCPDGPCPRGYKPCVMSLVPPANCDPRGMWLATIEKCPPKRKSF